MAWQLITDNQSTDNKLMNKRITILKGDGIGPEIVTQAVKVLHAIEKKYNHKFELDEALIGAAAIDATGSPLPEETVAAVKQSDAVLLGAVGDPKFDNNPDLTVRPEQGLLALRKSLGLHTNIRPTKIYPALVNLSPLRPSLLKDVDFVIYRELSSGIYFGEKGYRNEDKTTAFDTCEYKEEEIKTTTHLAFQAAQNRNKKLTLIDKANVLETSRLWRKCVQELSAKYPDVEVSYLFVDNAAMQMVLNPAQFDVIVTNNMFGDIISDEASILPGSIGLAPSSSIGENTALFEPIHGSYPQAAGKNIANPVATILSVAMMLEYFDLYEEATDIRETVDFCVANEIGTPDVFPFAVHKTSDVGEIISEMISEPLLRERLSEKVGHSFI